ncbi:Putative N-acetylmannosaminyltransferase [Microbulbifer aggregans]|uniref:N-acetylmannosaminyltransferase n=1 Tax=Microbulbifer aggregans TaxID=1769779 RepID=A0A1C9W7V3_9GAMM|nr:WecB/TagA/CpsF family glycosyltransferase [Microbulbifer aggregans]AOS97230.1 Putative N-acetylmannosaminyltransferase [Microbulbifer aggregans]
MDIISMKETVEMISGRLENRCFTQHVAVNVAKVINSRSDEKLERSVSQCDLINIDGMGVVWGARLLGYAVPERVAGVDLFHELLAMSAEKEFPVYFLGATSDVVERAAALSVEAHPGLKVAGFHHGYFWNDEEAVVEKIRQSGARLLFVAITSPLKENFINRWRQRLGVDFVMGVGGTFDVVAGKVRRAPDWMQNLGLEWLYRVIQEPRRMWRRYLVTNSAFAWLLIQERFRCAFSSEEFGFGD